MKGEDKFCFPTYFGSNIQIKLHCPISPTPQYIDEKYSKMNVSLYSKMNVRTGGGNG